MAFFETTASALDSASGSVLSSETLGAYTQSTRNCQNNRGAKLAWSESKVKSSRFEKSLTAFPLIFAKQKIAKQCFLLEQLDENWNCA